MKHAWQFWRDRRDRLSPLRIAVLALLLLPFAKAILEAGDIAHSARPINELIHRAGFWALIFLGVTLAVTPFRQIFRYGSLIDVRRMKAIVTILGVILLIVAAAYFLVPADSLPSFFPGHEAGLMRVRAKHGMSGASLETKATVDPLIHKAYLEELADAYSPGPLSRNNPLISPLFADLRGFPPTLIQVGSDETLLDDAVRFARALGLADANVTLEVWPHMIHAWPMWNAKLEDGRRALQEVGTFVRRWM